MSSFAVEHAKAQGYNELAELAVTATTKIARATESSDVNAILRDYFSKTVETMRRVGLACKTVDAGNNTLTLSRPTPPPRRWKAPDNFSKASIRERIGAASRN